MVMNNSADCLMAGGFVQNNEISLSTDPAFLKRDRRLKFLLTLKNNHLKMIGKACSLIGISQLL
jgi:hypothetical protein